MCLNGILHFILSHTHGHPRRIVLRNTLHELLLECDVNSIDNKRIEWKLDKRGSFDLK